ncbi:helix-turn-helix domain-containing protein [Nocardia nova]|jgi:hypothetical protein|uniref:helix-turn-helix domain-containing protein n=1 Tax=Nocardia nova TaxID=37330 RepID=UPI0007A37CD3|nr:helix-turn-helix domain-containing protein [Nocardia nova]
MDQDLALPQEVAAVLRTTTKRLATDRYKGTGIPFVKHGQRVLYRWKDVHAWIEQNTVQSTGSPAGTA